MKKTLLERVSILLLVLVGCAGLSFGQTALTQTTLSTAVNGPAFYSGTSPSISQTVTLASCSGLAAPILPGTPSSIIYVDREAMGIFAINTSSCVATVNRGYLGTQAAPHASGAMVLFGANYAVTIAQGGNPVPTGLFQADPPTGACTPTGTPSTPWVNVLTGAQWLCSSVTNTWVPGFNNPLVPVSSVPTTTIASASTITPSGPLFHMTGTTSVATINTPVGCNATAVGSCQFTIICDGICAWGTGGNISTASGTFVAGTAVTFIWNPATSKWMPSTAT